ncbi:MAG: hypothetical protein KA260_13520, partial [Burkholderiales bacterium]|nr:hypothetical protein [Burkholderiales bacterium]
MNRGHADTMQRTLILILFSTVLAACSKPTSMPTRSIDESRREQAQILASDPPVDSRGAPVVVELKILDASTGQPVREVIVTGRAKGQLKDEYVGHPTESRGFTYSEHDRALRGIEGPDVASKATLLDEGSSSRYRVHTPGAIQLSPGFKTLTKYYSWEGVILSKDYCARPGYVALPNDAKSALHAIAAARGGLANDVENHTVNLRPLHNDTPLRMRYHVLNSLSSLTRNGIAEGSPRAEIFDEVLGWAAPLSASPFEHLAYVSYLIRLKERLSRNQGTERHKTELRILSDRIGTHLPAARLSYYAFDDWQLVPETEQIVWDAPNASRAPPDQSCNRVNTSL